MAIKGFTHRFIPILIPVAFFFSLSSCVNSSNEETRQSRVPVSVMKAQKGTIENIIWYSGVVQPKALAYAVPSIPGKISTDFFEVGDRVKKGDLLYKLDDTELLDNIRIMEEQLKAAEATLSLAETGAAAAAGSQYESRKIQLETALKSAEYNFAAVKKAFDQAALLLEAGIINSQKYNEIKNRYEQAQTALESASKAYELYISELSKEAISTASDQLKQAAASYEALKLQLESARKKLAHTIVRSPIDGLIASKNIIPGCMVTGEMAPYTIINTDTVQIAISVTEQVINKVEKGQKLFIEMPSVKNEPYKGTIETVNPAVDPVTMAYNIRIDVPNKNGEIKPGMTARVGILTARRENCVLVPISAVIQENGDSFVFVAYNNFALKKPVTTGISNSKQVEINSGIKAGEPLIIKGHQFLNSNDPIIVTEEVP